MRANTRNVPAYEPFVIHCFEPLSTPAVAVRGRGGAQRAASSPSSGSVSAKRADRLAARQRGTKRVRCSSVPNARIGSVAALVCTATVTPTPASPRESSSEHEDVREEVGPRTAVLLGHADAHQAERAELREELGREPVLAVPGGRVGNDLGLDDLARERLDLALVLAEREVHRGGAY